MATKLGEAFVLLTTKDDLDKGLNAARRKVDGFLSNITQGIGRVIGAAISEIPKATRAASDLSETVSKTSTVFGEASREVLEWSKTSATAFGLSQRAALEATSSLGNMFIQLGENRDQAAGMSALMVELAADIASFNNVAGGAEEVLNDMSSAFRGEYDPIQKYIPIINAAAVEQQALAETGKGAAKELTALDKAIATQTLIMQGAGVAVGDFARTIQNVANQERILAAQVENFRSTLGQAFTPIYSEILRGLNQLVEQVSGYGDGIVRALAEGMVNGVIYLLPVITTIRDIFTYWLRPQSPPRILPDLDKWGRDAMQVYIDGFTKADFGALRTLGGSIESILRSFVGSGQLAETDLVARIFGSQAAVARAIGEWRQLGRVSGDALRDIRSVAGPAGDAVAGLVESYFDLEDATKRAADAQQRLDDVTRRYDARLSPLQGKLDAVQSKQQEIRDQQRLAELGDIITDRTQDVSTRRLARLEAEEIRLRQQVGAIEDERDAAVDAEQKKLEAVEKEQEAAQERFDLNQSVLEQQVKQNNLIAEETALRERLANEALAEQNKRLAEQEKLLRELEAEQRKAEAAEKSRLAELERTYQAQLNYNLATADSEGKLALLRLELGRYKEGSAEYYGILTQIANLEKQIANERAKGGSGAGLLPDVLPTVESLDVPTWAKELASKLQQEIDRAINGEPDFGISIKGGSSLFGKIIGPQPEKASEASGGVKGFVDALKSLTDAITGATPAVTGLAEAFGVLPVESGKATEGVEEDSDSMLKSLTYDINLLIALLTKDWAEAWRLFSEESERNKEKQNRSFENFVLAQTESSNGYIRTIANIMLAWTNFRKHAEEVIATFEANVNAAIARWAADFVAAIAQWYTDTTTKWGEAFSNMSETLGQWLTDTAKSITEFDLKAAGEALIKNFFSGITSYWDEHVAPWWEAKAQWVADMLPGSEPKNPASPLRDLGKRGEALVANIQAGMERATLSITPQIAGGLVGAATGVTNNSSTTHMGGVHLHFEGPVTQETIRKAVGTADDELRRRGFK